MDKVGSIFKIRFFSLAVVRLSFLDFVWVTRFALCTGTGEGKFLAVYYIESQCHIKLGRTVRSICSKFKESNVFKSRLESISFIACLWSEFTVHIIL